MILLDTNILIRHARVADSEYATVDAALAVLHANGEIVCIVPQNLYEFWAVATRPTAANGLGFSVPECQVEVSRIKQLFRFLPDLAGLYSEWEALVATHACHGRVSFDARLVAAMRTYGIGRLLTLNGADFARFPGVQVLDPRIIATPTIPRPPSPP